MLGASTIQDPTNFVQIIYLHISTQGKRWGSQLVWDLDDKEKLTSFDNPSGMSPLRDKGAVFQQLP